MRSSPESSSRTEPGAELRIRRAAHPDYARVMRVVDDWWGGRSIAHLLHPFFFIHFQETSLIAEVDRRLVGFLVGFLSQTFADQAYVHLLAVDPAYRGRGLGRELYSRFFEIARRHGRWRVRCVTAPVNVGSVAFHLKLGFRIEAGDDDVDSVAVQRDFAGPGENRVLLVKEL
jgi:ribosomal protein S18 acetylase RimI-like enzyme